MGRIRLDSLESCDESPGYFLTSLRDEIFLRFSLTTDNQQPVNNCGGSSPATPPPAYFHPTFMTKSLDSVISSIAYFTPSRPTPLDFTPP